jgi:hypothetical protein
MEYTPLRSQKPGVLLDQLNRSGNVSITHTDDVTHPERARAIRQLNRHDASSVVDMDMRWPVLTWRKENANMEPAHLEDGRHENNNPSVRFVPSSMAD